MMAGMENQAQIAEFQSQLIDKLDKVVAGSEALMMNERARTLSDFERLKAEIQALLDVVSAFERQCHGERGLQTVKDTIAALKRSVAENAEEKLPFGFEVLSEPMKFEPAAEPTPAEAAEEPVADKVAEEPVADKMAAEPTVEAVAVDKVPEKPKTIEPELGLQFDDVPMPAPEAEPVTEPEQVPEAVRVSEPASAPEAEPSSEPEPAFSADAVFEAIKQENLAQFSVREEDQPQSYITQLTAMAQAQVKPGEQDMSGVAVASTARPDAAAESVSSGDSLMESLRSTRANLHGGQLRTMVDKFKAPQTIYDIQHTRTVDLKMAIGVNEKYLLTRELFGDNVKEYTDAVCRLNEAKDAAAAKAIWQGMARQRAWDEVSLAYATFYDLLKRRFPDLEA